jgi:probable rRNA maturation factor
MSGHPTPDDDLADEAVAVARQGSLRVEGRYHASAPPVDVPRWCAVALTALAAEGVVAGRVDLSFVSADVIAELNEEHLGHEGPTDVLSFPYEEDPYAVAAADGPEVVLGDVVICAEIAHRHAPDHAGAPEDELALLVVHGVLHVLGWDHVEAADLTAMQRREAEVLAAAGFTFVHPAHR